MAQITTHATLKTAIADYLARSDLTSYIPYFIQGAEARVNKLRLRHMESAFSGTIAAGVVAVPAGYLETKALRVSSGGRTYPLLRQSIEQIYENYPVRSASGIPRAYAVEGGNFIFGPYPDSNYAISGVVYTKPAALSADGDTNWWITNNPLTFLYACLLEAEPFLKNDERVQLWTTMYAAGIKAIQDEEFDQQFGATGLQETLG